MSQLKGDPSLADETWRAFILEKEANSALSRNAWARYRQGLRRLEAKYRGRVPLAAMRRTLAEDAFFCGTHWRHGPRVVRRALRELLRQSPDLRLRAFAAAEYWAWAMAVSPADLEAAEQMLGRVRAAMGAEALDPLTRDNLERMLAVVGPGARRRTPGPHA